MDYSKLTKDNLMTKLAERGIKYKKKAIKDNLISLLKEDDKKREGQAAPIEAEVTPEPSPVPSTPPTEATIKPLSPFLIGEVKELPPTLPLRKPTPLKPRSKAVRAVAPTSELKPRPKPAPVIAPVIPVTGVPTIRPIAPISEVAGVTVPVATIKVPPKVKSEARLFVPSPEEEEFLPPAEKELLPHAPFFFGTRNGITFEKAGLKPDVNYTNETLSYMTAASMADRITNRIMWEIRSRLDFPMGDLGLIITECCAGIGGNSLSFLDNQSVATVISYEIDPVRREMLKRNIAAYDLGGKSRVPDDKDGFQVPGPELAGSIVYFDPPWLSKEIPGHISTSSQYLRRGIKVGAYTLEEWMNRMPHIAMIVLRVPSPFRENGKEYPGYELNRDQIPNWNCIVDDSTLGASGRLYLCTSPQGIANAMEKIAPLRVSPEEAEARWSENLKQLLRSILRGKKIPQKDINLILSDKVFPIWQKAFTHKTFDKDFNYESLEMIGDRVLKIAFGKYMMTRYPDITNEELSRAEQQFVSTKYQADMAKAMRLGSGARLRYEDISTKILEDLFESFFGALFEATGQVLHEGFGYTYAQNVVNALYDKRKDEVSRENLIRDDKTRFKEMLDKFGLAQKETKPDQKIVTSEGPLTRVTMVLKDHVINFFAGQGITVPAEIGTGVGNDQKLATQQAFTNAMNELNKLGVTEEWAQQVKDQREFDHPDLQPYLEPARERLVQKGFVNMKFFVPSSGRYKSVVQLIGIRKDGSEKMLGSAVSHDALSAKVIVLQNYTRTTEPTVPYP